MEAASLAVSVAQTLFAALQCQQLKKICSQRGYEVELVSLQDTVNTIKSVLLDADAKEVLSHQQRVYVEKLKAVVYDADDLLDEFTALAQQQQLHDDGIFSKLFDFFFPSFSIWGEFHDKVKEIKEELDAIATNASQFNFKIDYEPIRRRREETCSYVHEKDVIGREKETEDIINMLLAPDSDNHVFQWDLSVLAIVGMGGLGKTALAQHIYENKTIKTEFQLRLWACVADQDPDQLLLQPILAKILESATRKKQDDLGIELLQRQLRELLQGKKYLLILDDVWTENRNEWLKLENFLLGGGRGSRIIVTTRSEKTAQVVGSIHSYKLQGLSEENSWCLFERVAFGAREGRRDHHELAMIGKEIVKKCSNVPLSIRVVGSLLYGQEKKNWLEFQQCRLAEIIQGDNTLMPVLKLSYHHLQPAMKSCFSYCALFPKDEIIKKDTLISLWMAQGYIEPLHEGQGIEDAGEDYFLILLRRCFFQDVQKNKFGGIVSCKMHDLMHDMAQEVAGNEIFVMDSTTSSMDENVRHVNGTSYNNADHHYFDENKIRTCMNWMGPTFPINQVIFTKWTRLRVLEVRFAGTYVRSLSDSIGKLVHLRYIDLSNSGLLERLPESITQLHYLQTLILKRCFRLKELPECLSKLVKLRCLDIESCNLISCMPSGMDKLSSLRRLTTFVVSELSGESDKCASGLDELRALKDLRGRLTIKLRSTFRHVKEESRKGRYLSNKEHLNAIVIDFGAWTSNRGVGEGEKELVEDLQPHENLKQLKLLDYGHARMPRWATAEKLETSLPNLVYIFLCGCRGLQELPSFSKLQHLKRLKLIGLESMEYMENATSSAEEAQFFPSLEIMELHLMEKLKGWWRGFVRTQEWASFPRLSELIVMDCPNLKSFPFCPTVETLRLYRFNERLQIMIAEDEEEEKQEGCYSGNHGHGYGGSLREVETDNGRCLQWLLPVKAFRNLKEIIIHCDREMESFLQVGRKVLHSCSSSLRFLHLESLSNLRNLSRGGGGLEHLTALESLELHDLHNLSFDKEQGMPWRCLSGSLQSLRLYNLPLVKNLPKEMQHLTALQSLCIKNVHLQILPEWIGCLSSLQCLHIFNCNIIGSLPISMQQLTSLTSLKIYGCSELLYQRCQCPYGEDWPLIHHIPHIDIRRYG